MLTLQSLKSHMSSEILEAAVRRCFVKRVFLKMSQNLQENNTCARVSFLMMLQQLY